MYASASEIKDDARSAVVDLLYCLGDDDLLIGHRHSEWTGLAPILEADIAFSSMAQDQMGHALAYYTLLHELGEPDPDLLAFERGPEAFRSCSLVVLGRGDWALSALRQYLYDAAKSGRLEALAESTYTPLAHLARKLRGEQKYHLMHGRMWVSRLGNATEESHRLMQTALDTLFPHALGMFEPTRWDDTIVSEGIGPAEVDLCSAWCREVEDFLTESGLKIAADVTPGYGGRVGRHSDDLTQLLAAMQEVYRLDPTATW